MISPSTQNNARVQYRSSCKPRTMSTSFPLGGRSNNARNGRTKGAPVMLLAVILITCASYEGWVAAGWWRRGGKGAGNSWRIWSNAARSVGFADNGGRSCHFSTISSFRVLFTEITSTIRTAPFELLNHQSASLRSLGSDSETPVSMTIVGQPWVDPVGILVLGTRHSSGSFLLLEMDPV